MRKSIQCFTKADVPSGAGAVVGSVRHGMHTMEDACPPTICETGVLRISSALSLFLYISIFGKISQGVTSWLFFVEVVMCIKFF